MPDIKCPNCKMIHFETTDKYDPDRLPNGAMLQVKPKYRKMGWHNWLPVGKGRSNIMYSAIRCPQCKTPLVVKGRLTVVADNKPPERNADDFKQVVGDSVLRSPDHYCGICCREFKTEQALKAHTTIKHKD